MFYIFAEQVCVSVRPKPCSARQNIPPVYINTKKITDMTTIKIQNKNGRPKKLEAEKKKYKLTVKMETEEYYSLKAKARLAGINLSEYIRHCIEKSEIKQRLNPEHLGFIRQLSGMANNINQIARKANAVGYAEVHQECILSIAGLDSLIKLISE